MSTMYLYRHFDKDGALLYDKHRKIVKICRNEELFIKEMGMSFADFDKHIESIENEYGSKGGKL